MENENKPTNNGQNQGQNAQGGNPNAQGGNFRKRRHHHHGGGQNNNGGEKPQNGGSQGQQKPQNNGQKPQNQPQQNKPNQPQNHGQNGGNKPQNNAQNGVKQGQKPQNKPNQPQQKPQNHQNNAQNQGKNGQNQPQKQGQKPQNNNQNNGGNKVNQQQNQPKKQQNNGQNQPKKQQNQPQQKPQKQQNQPSKDTYAYVLDGNIYINLTNKCSNGCDFCVRNERSSYFGNYLWLRSGDPTAEKVIAQVKALGNLSAYKELVFCGFGEPTYKMEEMLAVATWAKEQGMKTRLNTNGQGNLINKRDVVPEMKGKIDFVNVSLNTADSESYQKTCRSQFRENAYPAVVDFARLCKFNGIACRFSIVDYIGEEEVEKCKQIASSNGIPLFVRKYITES